MIPKVKHTGFAIAIAWPQTYCKQPGTWYDFITTRLGINKNNYYKAGHAALVLIDNINRKCHYFDFGRYHSPFQYGRVRSSATDHDLEIRTIPSISADESTIENYHEILSELQLNPSCHGEGELHAAYCTINFQTSLNKANQIQLASPLPYGPFRFRGSNCSRFVNTTILAGKPDIKHKIRLNYFLPLTPTPTTNVNSLNNKIVISKMLNNEAFLPTQKLDHKLLLSTLPKPFRNSRVPKKAQWLSGEGVGSWFDLNYRKGLLKVTRYSPSGEKECSGYYKTVSSEKVFPTDNLRITYPSNCKSVTLFSDVSKLFFNRIKK